MKFVNMIPFRNASVIKTFDSVAPKLELANEFKTELHSDFKTLLSSVVKSVTWRETC